MATKTIKGHLFKHKNRVTDVRFSPDGALVLACAYDALVLRDVEGKERWRFGSGDIWHAVFAPGGRSIIAGGFSKTLIEIDVESGRARRTFPAKTNVFAIAMSADGTRIVSGERPNAQMFDATSAQLAGSFVAGKATKMHTPTVNSAAFSPNGNHVALTCGKSVHVLDANTAKPVYSAQTDKYGAAAVVFVNDDVVATVGTDAAVAVRDVTKRSAKKPLRSFATSCETSSALALHGTRVVTGGNGPVELWNFESGAIIATLAGVTQADAVAFSPDGAMVAAASVDNAVVLWSV